MTGVQTCALPISESLASYGSGETFPHDAAEGFIRLAGLETELAAIRAGKEAARV